MARESSLWNWLKKARLEIPDVLHMERVENMLGAGFPDVDGFLSPHGAFQLELKSTKRPARSATPVRFALQDRDAQIKFMRTRWDLGANAFFFLQVGEASERVLYLAPGNVGDKLKAGILEAALALECLNTGIFKPPFSRKDILKVITTCRRNPCHR